SHAAERRSRGRRDERDPELRRRRLEAGCRRSLPDVRRPASTERRRGTGRRRPAAARGVRAAGAQDHDRRGHRQTDRALRHDAVFVLGQKAQARPDRLRPEPASGADHVLADARHLRHDPASRELAEMHDLVTLGEVLLRLAAPSPARFETAQTLDVQIGGAEANVAGACARLGLRTAWISAVPANPWGDRVLRELSAHGIDCSHVQRVDGARLGVYFLEYGVPPRPTRVLYDRRGSAFAELTTADVDWEPVRHARLVHMSGVTPALGEASRALVRRAIAEAPAASFDVNYRASLWSRAEAREFIDRLLPTLRYLFLGEAE